MAALVFTTARGLLRTPMPTCFPGRHSSALVWVEKGAAALEAGAGAGLANIPHVIPVLALAPSPLAPTSGNNRQFCGFLSCLPISSLKHGASGPSPKEITSLVGAPHGTPHLVGLTGHKGSFGTSFSGQLARDPGQTISQSAWKVSFPFLVALEKKEGWRQKPKLLLFLECLSNRLCGEAMPENNRGRGPQ